VRATRNGPIRGASPSAPPPAWRRPPASESKAKREKKKKRKRDEEGPVRSTSYRLCLSDDALFPPLSLVKAIVVRESKSFKASGRDPFTHANCSRAPVLNSSLAWTMQLHHLT
jgi:hypothetical protein